RHRLDWSWTIHLDTGNSHALSQYGVLGHRSTRASSCRSTGARSIRRLRVRLCCLDRLKVAAIEGQRVRMRKLQSWYVGTSVIFLSTCLCLLFIQILLSGILYAKHVLRPDPGPIWKYGWRPVEQVYPGWSRKDILELLNEFYADYSLEYEPFTEFRERPRRKEYVTVDAAGFRVVKNQGPWPLDHSYTNIFVFGGSTTFGYGVTNEQTIPSYLQEAASSDRRVKGVRVYNFGRGFYFSSQETILFSLLLSANVVPDIAVFIDGLNDFVYLNREPEYSPRLRRFMNGAQLQALLSDSTINRAAGFVRARILASSQPVEVKVPSSVEKSNITAVLESW